jgi:penicillin-binding protein 1A
VPVRELTPPEGVVQADGDWSFEEFSGGSGVRSLGLEDVLPPPPTTEERSSILDLFRR